MLPYVVAIGTNVIAIVVLVYAIYYRRHFRRDLALAYMALNMGVMAVTMLLAGSEAGLGLGLGLFGILSIIRLRSDTLTQEEVAYYFVALALGLINGLHPDPIWLPSVLSVALLLVMAIADHSSVARRSFRQTITLDRAYPNPDHLNQALAQLLGAKIQRVIILELDVVRDLTVVDVRYKLPQVSTSQPQGTAAASYGVADQSKPEMAQFPIPEISRTR